MSKADGQFEKPPLTAEQQKKADAVIAFQKQWNDVKDRVYEGKLTPEELKATAEALFKHRFAAGPDGNMAVQDIVKDCKTANISNDNLHKFVGAAIAAEFEFEKTKPSTSGLMRLTSASVASTLLSYEMDKQGFKPLSLDTVKKGTDKQVIDAYMDVKIPEFIQDHYKPILDYSKEREAEKRKAGVEEGKIRDVQETYTNLVFCTVSNPLILENNAKLTKLQAELAALPKGEQAAKRAEVTEEQKKTGPITTKIAEMSYAAYPSKGDKDSVGNPNPVFAKVGMYEALEKQFDSDKTKQQLSAEKMQELKERAYARDAIQKERRQALYAGSSQTPEKVQAVQKETKAETASKSFADRFHDIKNRVAQKVDNLSEKAEALRQNMQNLQNRGQFDRTGVRSSSSTTTKSVNSGGNNNQYSINVPNNDGTNTKVEFKNGIVSVNGEPVQQQNAKGSVTYNANNVKLTLNVGGADTKIEFKDGKVLVNDKQVQQQNAKGNMQSNSIPSPEGRGVAASEKAKVEQKETKAPSTFKDHQFTAEDAKTLAKKLAGKAIEHLGSKGNEVTSKLGKDLNTGINTGSIASPVAKRAADIIKDSLAHPSHQPSSPKNDPKQSHPPARPGSKPPPRSGQHDGSFSR